MKRLVLIGLLAMALSRVNATETTIRGGRMELINQGDTVLFTKGVRLERGTDRLESNKMRTNRTRDKITAEGNVRLFRKVSATETWKATGETGYYDTQTGAGYLVGEGKNKAHVIHTEVLSSTSSRIVHVYADRIDFFRETRKANAKGAVEGQTTDPETKERYDFSSEHADFDGEKKEITLYGVPQSVVTQFDGKDKRTITGNKIVYNPDSRHLISEGSAQAVFEDAGEKQIK